MAHAEVRQPTGPWRVNYDPAQCVALRQYGTDEKPFALMLKPSPNGGVMRVIVARKGGSSVEQVPVTLMLGAARRETNQLEFADDKNHFHIFSVNVPMVEFKEQQHMATLGWKGGALYATFAMTGLPEVLTELDKCLSDLQDYWNVGDRYSARVSKEGISSQPLNQLFSGNDYPWVSLTSNQQGAVTMTFLVDETGAIKDCSVDSTSGIPALDTMSCYVISRRAHFSPAIGPDGKPVRSAYTKTVKWQIETKH